MLNTRVTLTKNEVEKLEEIKTAFYNKFSFKLNNKNAILFIVEDLKSLDLRENHDFNFNQEPRDVQIPITLEEEDIRKLDFLAKYYDLNRSNLVSVLIQVFDIEKSIFL